MIYTFDGKIASTEDTIREMIRDEMGKYFCKLQNDEEYYDTEISNLENQIDDLEEVIKHLKKENEELKHLLAQREFELALKDDKVKKEPFKNNLIVDTGGFMF